MILYIPALQGLWIKAYIVFCVSSRCHCGVCSPRHFLQALNDSLHRAPSASMAADVHAAGRDDYKVNETELKKYIYMTRRLPTDCDEQQ